MDKVDDVRARSWRKRARVGVDRHKLLDYGRRFANAYDRQQFHVRHNGLALLVAYLLHLILIRHITPLT